MMFPSYNTTSEYFLRDYVAIVLAILRTFALIVSAHPTAHANSQATSCMNDRVDGQFYSFAWI